MEKNWFILQGDQHKGPFSSPEIVDLFVNGKVSQEDLLWRDGEDDWHPLADFSELTTMIKFQGTSLDINVSDVSLAKYRNKQRQQQMALDEARARAELLKLDEELEHGDPPPLPALPPLPGPPSSPSSPEFPELPDLPTTDLAVAKDDRAKTKLAVARDDRATTELATANDDQTLQELFSNDNNKQIMSERKAVEFIPLADKNIFLTKISAWTFRQWAISLSAGIILILSLTFFLHGHAWDRWIINYPIPLQKKFLKTLKSSGALAATFHWDYVEKKLYGVINRWGVGSLQLELASIENKILGDEAIKLSAQGKIIAGQILFDPLQLVQGQAVTPGSYSFRLTGHQSSALANLFDYFNIHYFPGHEKTFSGVGEVTFFEGTAEIFQAALARFNNIKKARELRAMQEVLQQYKTFNSSLIEILNTYAVHLDTISKGVQIKRFERQYMEKIGPLLQGLILDDFKIRDELRPKYAKRATMYAELISLGKKITALPGEMSHKTRQSRLLRSSIKKALLDEFTGKVEVLKQQAAQKIEYYTHKISPPDD